MADASTTHGYTNTNSLFLQSEVVRPKFQEWLESYHMASDLIDSQEVQRVGERDFRVPVLLQTTGRGGTYDINFGDMGRGASLAGDRLISTFFPLRMNFELSKLKMDATRDKEVSPAGSVFGETIKRAMKEYAVFNDFAFHTDGTAVAGTATSHTTTSGQTVYTMDANFGIQRLRRGMYVVVYSSDFNTLRASDVFITKVDYPNKKITINITVTGAADTDVICFDGVTGTTGAAPNWKQGLYYHNSYATSGTFLGLDRAVEPELAVNAVNANGTITWNHALLLLDQMGQRRGEIPEGIVGLANVSQRAQIYTEQVALTVNVQTSKEMQARDFMPAQGSSFPFAGVDHRLDYRQDRSRIDWIVPKLWIKARLNQLGYFEIGGQRFFFIAGPSGVPLAGLWFSLTQDENWVSVDPGSQGVIYGGTLPTGY